MKRRYYCICAFVIAILAMLFVLVPAKSSAKTTTREVSTTPVAMSRIERELRDPDFHPPRATTTTLERSPETVIVNGLPWGYSPHPVTPPTVRVIPSGDPKLFIYDHESGNNPSSIARNGPCGLGQAYPCSKLHCPLSAAGYACQDAWFTSYCITRYGSWNAARAHWISLAHWDAKRQDWVGGSW